MHWVSIADIHLNCKDKYGVLNNGFNTRFSKKLGFVRQAADYASYEKVDFFVVLGDIVDSISEPEDTKAKFFDALEPLFLRDIPIFIVLGNHDYNIRKDAFVSVRNVLEKVKTNRIFIFTNLFKTKILDQSFIFAPFGTEKYISSIPFKKKNILFGHFRTHGSLMNSGKKAEKGVDRNILRKFFHVELGDFHKRQEFYIGCLARANFSDKDNPTGFCHSIMYKSRVDQHFIPTKDNPFIHLKVKRRDTLNVTIPKDSILKITVENTDIPEEEILNFYTSVSCYKKFYPVFKRANVNGVFKKDQLTLSDFISKYAKERGKSHMIEYGNKIIERLEIS